jgi:hypothetical protein
MNGIGYHDVCSVILLVMEDERMAYYLIERMSLLHIRYHIISAT